MVLLPYNSKKGKRLKWPLIDETIGEAMFSILRRKKLPLKTVSDNPLPAAEVNGDFLQPMIASELLATPRRQMLLKHIWQRTALSRTQFESLYQRPIERYAALVQQFPASEAHHHSYPGGMIDHGLEIVAYALKLRQSHLLPIGSSSETQTAQSEAWTAGVAYAALLHDIGKIAVDIDVETPDGKSWHPWYGPLTRPYRFRYRANREYRLHSAAAGLLYNHILDQDILDWLSTFPALWSALLYVLAGQMEHAGILGELVTKADQASVAQEMGGDPVKALTAPKHALQRKLLDGLRYLIKESLKLNQPEASDGWLTDDGLWLVSKTVSDKLRAHLLSQGISGIPEKNTAVFDVLQEHGIAQSAPNGKAIWKVAINSKSGWSNTLTVFKVVPALIWEAGDRPDSFEGSVVPVAQEAATESEDSEEDTPQSIEPAQTVTLMTPPAPSVKADSLDAVLDLLGPNALNQPAQILTEPVTAPAVSSRAAPAVNDKTMLKSVQTATPGNNEVEPGGEHFVAWLREAILFKKLIINDAQAMVHTVADTVFLVTPSLFVRYAHEFPQSAKLAKLDKLTDWEWAQKQFERLKIHRRQPNGLNIWTCVVSGPRKTRKLHGYLLASPELIMPNIPFNNPYLSLSNEKDQ